MPNNSESRGTTSGNRDNQANAGSQQMNSEKQKTQMSGGQSGQKPPTGRPDDKNWNDPARSGGSGGQQSHTGSGTGGSGGQNVQHSGGSGQSSGSGKSGSGGSGQGSGSDRNS
jgi:hypothetical protein